MLEQSLDFLHDARAVREIHPVRVERIRRRLQKATPRRHRTVRWPAWAALALVFIVGAGFAAAHGHLRSLPLVDSFFSSIFRPEPGPMPPNRKTPQRRSPTTPAADPVGSEAPVVEPATLPGAPAPATSAKVAGPTKSSALPALALRQPQVPIEPGVPEHDSEPQPRPAEGTPVARAQAPIVLESHSFAAVIEAWHGQHDADAALALLDAHERRYPNGAMHMETRVLRAELYLAQHHENAALAVLDGLALAGLPRGRELATVRGELRVKAGRCAEARMDLGGVLEENIVDLLARRAAQALSHCP